MVNRIQMPADAGGPYRLVSHPHRQVLAGKISCMPSANRIQGFLRRFAAMWAIVGSACVIARGQGLPVPDIKEISEQVKQFRERAFAKCDAPADEKRFRKSSDRSYYAGPFVLPPGACILNTLFKDAPKPLTDCRMLVE